MVDQPRRRWFRFAFSLRTLLVLVTLAAGLVAWVAKERRQSAREVQIAEQLKEQGIDQITFGGRFDLWKLHFEHQPQGWWRDLAGQVLGERIVLIEDLESELKNLTSFAELANLQALAIVSADINDLSPLT